MPSELIKKLLEAGVHFGHQTKRWNPKMKKFIFGQKAGVYIIDLEKTVACIERAQKFVSEVISQGNFILLVGTKKQAQEIIGQEAQRCGSFYVNYRWLGGLLTNFSTLRQSVKRLREIEAIEHDGRINNITKKEAMQLLKERDKLRKNLAGVLEMERLPGAMFVIDPKREETAVREARRLNIPTIALIDTNGDPDLIDYPIPGNDDAIRSIKAITTLISESVIESKKSYQEVLRVLEERKQLERAESEAKSDKELVVLEQIEEIEEEVIDKKAPEKPRKKVGPKKTGDVA